MTGGAVEEKVDTNLGVQGSNPHSDCHFWKIFRTAKNDDSYVWIPTKTDQNDEKNVRALVGFGEVKPTKIDNSYAWMQRNSQHGLCCSINNHILLKIMSLRDCEFV